MLADVPTGHAAGLRRWLGRVDPLIAVCGVAALCVYLLNGFGGILDRDLALYAYGGQQFADGVLPYVAVLNRAGPLAHAIPGVAVIVSRAIGVDEIQAIRVLFMLIAIACIAVIYVLGRDLFRSRLAGLVAASALLSFHGFILFATNGPREKTAMVLFVLIALLAMTYQRWLTAGVMISLATLTWQPAFFAALAGVTVAVLLGVRRQEWLHALSRIVLGGAIPVIVTLAVYAAAGKLRFFFDCFYLINARYTRQSPLRDDWGGAWDKMVGGYGRSLWILLIGLAALVVAAGVTMVRQRDRRLSPLDAALVGTAVFAVVATAWTVLIAYDGWPDVMVLLPAGALGAASLVYAARGVLQPRPVAVMAGAMTAAATVSALSYAMRADPDGLDEQRAAVSTVTSVLPDATIFSVKAPQPLVFAEQRNASRIQMFGSGFADYVDATWPGGLDGYGRWIGEQRPTVIAIGGREVPRWLSPTIPRAYARTGYTSNWTWFVRRDVGREKLHQLRDALDDQSRAAG